MNWYSSALAGRRYTGSDVLDRETHTSSHGAVVIAIENHFVSTPDRQTS